MWLPSGEAKVLSLSWRINTRALNVIDGPKKAVSNLCPE
jgi:hypothetical protein